MLASFDNSPATAEFETHQRRPHSTASPQETKQQEQTFSQLLDREWSDLPYAMMRLTAARRPWDNNRVYWRDRTVQLGEINLTLRKGRTPDDAPRYTASYQLEDLRHHLVLHPLIADDQLRWSAPHICATASLTTQQLAEKLLCKLITFYTTGMPQPATQPATSSTSPDPSS